MNQSQNYECSDCDGFCCRNGYRITVGREEMERLSSLEAVQEVLQQKGISFPPYPLREETWFLPQETVEEKLECAFLDEEKLCLIHKRHGYDAKPGVCKAYPFCSTNEGEARQLAYTFQCKSIRQNYGKPLKEATENERPFLQTHPLPRNLPLLQSGEKELPIQEHLAVWNEVGRTFLQAGTPERVIIEELTKINENFSEKAFKRSVPALFSWFWNMTIVVEPVAEGFSEEWFAGFESCLEKLGLSDKELEKAAVNREFWKSLQVYHKQIPFLLQGDGSEEYLQRYFQHVIDRKTFLMKSPSLFLALVSLLYCWEFLQLHAKILSVIAEEEKGISRASLERAIIGTEGNFAFHKLAGKNLYPPNIEHAILSLIIP